MTGLLKNLPPSGQVYRTRDLAKLGFPRYQLSQLVRTGDLQHLARGLYMRSNTELTEHHSLVEIAARCPKAVFGLVTALSFHNLTTENPETVWMFLPRNSQAPKTNLMLDIFWASDESYAAGVETHLIEGVPVKITNPAKTVVDCFKFRNRVGIPLAVEALKDAWRQRKVTTRDLCEYAEICRMTNVMRPYFEAIIS